MKKLLFLAISLASISLYGMEQLPKNLVRNEQITEFFKQYPEFLDEKINFLTFSEEKKHNLANLIKETTKTLNLEDVEDYIANCNQEIYRKSATLALFTIKDKPILDLPDDKILEDINFIKMGFQFGYFSWENQTIVLSDKIFKEDADTLISILRANKIPLKTENSDSIVNLILEYESKKILKLLMIRSNPAEEINDYKLLLVSVAGKNHKLVNILLNRGVYPYVYNHLGSTPLHSAAITGNVKSLILLLERLCSINANEAQRNINHKDLEGNTPLLLACKNGQLEAAEFLIENEADIELENKNEITPLMIAAQNGHTEIVKLLLKHNANPNRLIYDYTALTYASEEGYKDLVKLLLKDKFDLQEIPCTKALMYSVKYGYFEILKQFLTVIDSDQLDNQENLLISLAKVNIADIFYGLLKHKENKNDNLVNLINYLQRGNPRQAANKIYQILFSTRPSKLSIKLKEELNHLSNTIKNLVDKISKLHKDFNNLSRNIYSVASKTDEYAEEITNANLDNLEKFLSANIEQILNKVNQIFDTFEISTKLKKEFETLYKIIRKTYHQADQTCRILKIRLQLGEEGFAEFIDSFDEVQINIKKMAEIIVSKDTDINHQDENGCTALMHAIENLNIELVKYFLTRKDININICDNENKNALTYAQLNYPSDKSRYENTYDEIKTTGTCRIEEEERLSLSQEILILIEEYIKTSPKSKRFALFRS